MLRPRPCWFYRLKSLLCVVLILQVHYWHGCGTPFIGQGQVIRVDLTPDHPLAQALSNTAFAGAKVLEIYPDTHGFRLIYEDASLALQGGFGNAPAGLELTDLQLTRRGRLASLEINPATKQVTRLVSPRGDEWRPQKLLTAREARTDLTGAEAYAAANPELAEFVADPDLMTEALLDDDLKDDAAQLLPTIILLAFLFNFCPGCLFYAALFLTLAIIIETIMSVLFAPPVDEPDDTDDPPPPPPAPTGPTAIDDAAVTSRSVPVVINVLANDVAGSIALDPSSVSVVQPPTNGNTEVDPISGAITYTPDENFFGLDNFRYQVCDSVTPPSCSTANVAVLVNLTNEAPVANDDEAEAIEDGPPVLLTLEFLLDNDFDPDPGDLIEVVAVTDSVAGAVVTLLENSVHYDHTGLFQELAEGANTTDTFTYTIEDLFGAQATATVTVTITGVNDPPVANDDDVDAVEDDTPAIFPAALLLANDFDIDEGDVITIVATTNSAAGATVTIDGDNVVYDHTGMFQELPEGGTTTDTFTYTIEDSFGAQDTATVTVTITGVNDPPVANDDEVGAIEDDTPAIFPAALLLDNDFDIDEGDVITIVATTNSAAGAIVTIDGDNVVYDHTGMFQELPEGGTTTDTFTYTIEDSFGAQDTATVTVTITGVNDPPVANDDEVGAIEDDTPAIFPAALLLDNDFDIDEGDVITIVATTNSAAGAIVTIDGDNVVYDHTGMFQELPEGGTTTDTFTYTIEDLFGAQDTATVTVTITGVNDPPVANDDVYPNAAIEDGPPLQVPIAFVLANDTDVDQGDVLTVVDVAESVAGASVSISGDFIIYDHTGLFQELGQGANTTDMFTYTISDLFGAQDTATVTVTITGVNDPPVANDDEGEAIEDGPPVELPIADLLANDFDVDEGDTIMLVSVTNSAAGALVSIVGDNVVYDHTGLFQELAEGATTTDTFTYTIEDSFGAQDTATVTMTITGVNDPPVANDDEVDAVEDDAPAIFPAALLLANDFDIDEGDVITIVDTTNSVAGAIVTIDGDNVVYDHTGLFQELAEGATTMDTFTYTIQDLSGAQDTATVTVTITGVNDPPIVDPPGMIEVDEDSVNNPLGIGAPTDVDEGDVLTITVIGLPDGMIGFVKLGDGSETPVVLAQVLSESELTGLLFDTEPNASGDAGLFEYEVTDGIATVSSSVSIFVTPIADTPILNVSNATGIVNEPIDLDIQAELTDTDGSEVLSITIEDVPTGATLSAGTDTGGGVWSLTPGDLIGLTITIPDTGVFDLSVTATATELANNDMASVTETLTVTVEDDKG